MRQWIHVVVPAVVLGLVQPACQQGTAPDRDDSRAAAKAGDQEPDPVAAAFARDVERICFCQERSGALQRPEGERTLIVAQWLGANLESQEGRTFLAGVARVPPAEKVALLDKEAVRLGLASCPLARTWDQGPPAGESP